jgi:hypothetical protein
VRAICEANILDSLVLALPGEGFSSSWPVQELLHRKRGGNDLESARVSC